MKKILASFAVIGMVGAGVAGLTGAYFSDTAASTGNTFSAGTLNLQLTDNNETTPVESVTASFGGANLYPGQDLGTADIMQLHNSGNVNAHHANLTVSLPAGYGSDLARNLIFTSLRFSTNPDGTSGVELVNPFGDGDYTVKNPVTGVPINAGDLNVDGVPGISLQDLAQYGKIRIEANANHSGLNAGSTAHVVSHLTVGTGLTAQGQNVNATFTWELQQDASQQ